jgi:hypothetical protein
LLAHHDHGVAEKRLAKGCELMGVPPYPLEIVSRPPGFLSWSGELVSQAPDVDWYVAALRMDHYQAVHGRLGALHVQVLIAQSLAVA